MIPRTFPFSFTALGPAPQYFSADAADYDSLKRAYDTIVKENGKVRGIIHSAIVLSDQSFANMEEDHGGMNDSADLSIFLHNGVIRPFERVIIRGIRAEILRCGT